MQSGSGTPGGSLQRRHGPSGSWSGSDGSHPPDDSDSNSDEDPDSEPEGGEGPPLVYVLNLVTTKHDKALRRGADVKAMAICTRHPFLHIYKVSHWFVCQAFVPVILVQSCFGQSI